MTQEEVQNEEKEDAKEGAEEEVQEEESEEECFPEEGEEEDKSEEESNVSDAIAPEELDLEEKEAEKEPEEATPKRRRVLAREASELSGQGLPYTVKLNGCLFPCVSDVAFRPAGYKKTRVTFYCLAMLLCSCVACFCALVH